MPKRNQRQPQVFSSNFYVIVKRSSKVFENSFFKNDILEIRSEVKYDSCEIRDDEFSKKFTKIDIGVLEENSNNERCLKKTSEWADA